MNVAQAAAVLLPLALAPLCLGIVTRVKATCAGRRGPPLLQGYFDIIKLCRKDFVYSRTVSPVFQLAPVVALAAVLCVITLLPVFSVPPLLAFPGDVIVVAYLLALARFFVIVGALDTGSSFEGMGASREAFFAIVAELSIFMAFIALALACHAFSLSAVFAALPYQSGSLLLRALLAGSFFVILLLECSRIPFDDPNTHLELTMIHEVMVLDHGSADLAIVEYASALKMWVLASLVAQLAVPDVFASQPLALAVNLAGVAGVAVAVGVVESTMARLRLRRVPYVLLWLFVVVALAAALTGAL